MKIGNYRINSFSISPTKMVAGILLIIGWYTGEISNLVGFMVLFILFDFEMTWDL